MTKPSTHKFVGTTCPKSDSHQHNAEAELTVHTWPFENVSSRALEEPVTYRQTRIGLVRFVGFIYHFPATGRMHCMAKRGATESDQVAILATAKAPKQDPDSWPAHPCDESFRAISLYRVVDEDDVALEAEAFLQGDAELQQMLSSAAMESV
ncbi:hypothetical protein [Zhihengliuella halotolerans]|uniref:hypothetical protein n=1 Tax=Zhihengliuella halotolerans TaxID=370736 RepID=UPI000C7FED98|nr:hypothetical protein [Zhihengliuella halotolerans]